MCRSVAAPEDDGAGDALQVFSRVEHYPDILIYEARDRFVLVVTDLAEEMAARVEKARGFADKTTNDGEAVAIAGR